MYRQPLKQVSVGETGAGKTKTNMDYLRQVYSNPKNPHAKKSLIYDANMEFKDVKILGKEDVPNFIRQKQIEIRRILPLDEYGNELGMDDKYELFCELVDNFMFRNGLLYLEDPNNYVTAAHTKHFINLLTTNRHKLLDIYISLQTFGALPPRIWGNVNVLNIHSANDDPFTSKIKEQIPGKIEPLRIANIMVQDRIQYNKFFHNTFNFQTLKITGDFTTDDFISACEKYLALNKKKVKDFATMHEISIEDAKQRKLIEFMHKYNGNVKLKTQK